MVNPLIVRYSALFGADRDGALRELALSAAGVRAFVAPHVPIQPVVYTLPEHQDVHQRLFAALGLGARVVVLEDPQAAAFADSIEHCLPVDRICIRRMLADFTLLPTDHHRLLVGTDCFFLAPPEEVLSHARTDAPAAKVLYAVDNLTWDGERYRLRFWDGPILPGLLGDFYCLAPGVSLSTDAIVGALRLIDSWPTDVTRWSHPTGNVQPRACEQQAAAMLLAAYPASELPPERYPHYKHLPGAVMVHTHELGSEVLPHLDRPVIALASEAYRAAIQPDAEEARAG
jgi:hypothetical protein